MSMVDWGQGHYESTAAQLLPVARKVVDRARPAPGENVVDVGCGTGNAALLAAERGAQVTGVDPAERLLEVARADAEARGLEATFVKGDAASIPLDDGTMDLVLSVFGVIFAPDPKAAGDELARVCAPGGRIVLSAWIPYGAISASVREARETISAALGTPPGPPPFPWHEQDALEGLFGPHGFEVSLREETQSFGGPSLSDYIHGEFQNHPMWVAGRAVLEPRGELEPLLARTMAIFEEANEADDGFSVTSRYVIATATRSGAAPG
jgi:SAM-dependent methyltransferase